jgi:hypothetical protein
MGFARIRQENGPPIIWNFLFKKKSSDFPLQQTVVQQLMRKPLQLISMVYQWYINGISMVYQWYINGISMVYQWYINGISMVYQWYIGK